MPLVFLLLVLALLAVVAVVAAGRGGELTDPVVDRAPLGLPEEGPLDATALQRVRFSLGFRGYRMDQVDGVLDRVGAELAERDARIAELQSALDGERRRRQPSPELAPTTREA
ncbi:MAG: DivIVA domain-containing protein [Actinomycetota bacterium]|nr:DivIVA domain-containing protein [Actinomycetota bacterium]